MSGPRYRRNIAPRFNLGPFPPSFLAFVSLLRCERCSPTTFLLGEKPTFFSVTKSFYHSVALLSVAPPFLFPCFHLVVRFQLFIFCWYPVQHSYRCEVFSPCPSYVGRTTPILLERWGAFSSHINAPFHFSSGLVWFAVGFLNWSRTLLAVFYALCILILIRPFLFLATFSISQDTVTIFAEQSVPVSLTLLIELIS